MIKHYFLILFCSCIGQIAWAQMGGFGAAKAGNGRVFGTIIDSITGDPIDYATVSLMLADFSKPTDGTIQQSA